MPESWEVTVRPTLHRQACWSDVDFVHGIGIFSESSSHDAANIPHLPLRYSSTPSHLRGGPRNTRSGSFALHGRGMSMPTTRLSVRTDIIRQTSSMDIHLPSHPRVASRPSTSLTMAMEAICRTPPARDPHIPTASVQPKLCTPSSRTTTGARRL